MKSLSFRIRLAFILAILSVELYGQYPPAQGPPEGDRYAIPVQIVNIRNILDSIFRDSIIPELNRIIAENDPPVRTHMVYSFKQGRPVRSKTKYTDRPNEVIISIPYYFTYNLKMNNVPNRYIYQKLTIQISCFGWYRGIGGEIKFLINAEKPVMDERDLVDLAADAVARLLSFISTGEANSITGLIRENMPDRIKKIISIRDVPLVCNCLSVGRNGIEYAGDEYYSSFFAYQYKRPEPSAVNDNIVINFQRIRRLNSHDDNGNLLYDSLENINLEFYANHQVYSFQANQVAVGQTIDLPESTISVVRPKKNGTLIIIANIIQSGNFNTDTRFAVFDSAAKFGHGPRKLIIKKKYWSKPFRLGNGQMSKPKEMFTDAYELTYTVSANTVTDAVRQGN